MRRSLTTGSYFTLLEVSDNNIPSTPTTYSDSSGTPITIDLNNNEYFIASEKSATQILKVTIN